MVNIAALQLALAQRTEVVLGMQDDPSQAMREVEAAAYSGGLVSEATHLDRSSPEEFSQYLWVHNPIAHDWLNLKRGSIPGPQMVRDMPDLMDVLGS
jgi:hypothetical protein